MIVCTDTNCQHTRIGDQCCLNIIETMRHERLEISRMLNDGLRAGHSGANCELRLQFSGDELLAFIRLMENRP